MCAYFMRSMDDQIKILVKKVSHIKILFENLNKVPTMPICLIAKEIYKFQSRVHKLENELEHCSHHEREEVLKELQVARFELKRVRTMLDNKKETGVTRQPTTFPFTVKRNSK